MIIILQQIVEGSKCNKHLFFSNSPSKVLKVLVNGDVSRGRMIFNPNKQYLIRFHPAREIREFSVVFSTDAETDAFIHSTLFLD